MESSKSFVFGRRLFFQFYGLKSLSFPPTSANVCLHRLLKDMVPRVRQTRNYERFEWKSPRLIRLAVLDTHTHPHTPGCLLSSPLSYTRPHTSCTFTITAYIMLCYMHICEYTLLLYILYIVHSNIQLLKSERPWEIMTLLKIFSAQSFFSPCSLK